MSKNDVELHVVTWQGRDVGIRYQRGLAEDAEAILQVWDFQGRPLPISEAGIRTHYDEAENIEFHGGPVAVALAWLDLFAGNSAWKQAEEARRQYSFGF